MFDVNNLQVKSNIKAIQLEEAINKIKQDNKLKGLGTAFIDAENKYNVNAIILASIACLESGYGTSKLAIEKNNLFGLDAPISATGTNNYGSGYKNKEECIDYAGHRIGKQYLELDSKASWRYCEGKKDIYAVGAKWCEVEGWADKVISIANRIEKNINGGNSMKIEKVFLDKNKYSRPGTKRNKTTKIAWHYVGNPGSSAKANRNYFNNAPNHKTSASSHYIIGLEGEIIYCVPEDEIAYTTNSANSYSIGIEMCHPDSTGKFNSLTYNAAVELGVDLAKRYKLNPLTDFIRHYDVTKKCCPKYWVDNNSAWEKFKQDVNNKLNEYNTQGSPTTTFKNGDYTGKKAKVTANVLNVRYDRGTQYNVIGKLNKGDIVKLNYCLNGWISIEGYKGNKGLGYISTDYLELI